MNFTSERSQPYSDAIVGDLRRKFSTIPEALILAFGPPPIQGVGSTGGFTLMVQDRRGGNFKQLEAVSQSLVDAGEKRPELVGMFSGFRAETPEIYVDVDRSKAKSMDVPLNSIFDALQIYLGSAYVNDFTFLGRSFQVNVQADSKFRVTPADILKLKTRNVAGQMVPLSTMARSKRLTARPLSRAIISTPHRQSQGIAALAIVPVTLLALWSSCLANYFRRALVLNGPTWRFNKFWQETPPCSSFRFASFSCS